MALCAVKDCPAEAAVRGSLTLEDISTSEQFECEIPICAGHAEEIAAGGFELVLDPDRMPRGIATGVLASGLDGDPTATPCRRDPNEAQQSADDRGDGLCECGFPPGQHSFVRAAGALTAAEFERAYAERSGVTVEWLRAHGRVVVRCWCAEPDCDGWASVSAEGAADYAPGGIYHRALSQVGARAEAFAAEFERKASRARHPLVRRWYERREGGRSRCPLTTRSRCRSRRSSSTATTAA